MERRPVTFRIDPAIIKKLKYLALDHDRTLTDLFLEAIQDLLMKYEKRLRNNCYRRLLLCQLEK